MHSALIRSSIVIEALSRALVAVFGETFLLSFTQKKHFLIVRGITLVAVFAETFLLSFTQKKHISSLVLLIREMRKVFCLGYSYALLFRYFSPFELILRIFGCVSSAHQQVLLYKFSEIFVKVSNCFTHEK